MSHFVREFAADESGVTAVEYGIIAALIALVLVGSVHAAGIDARRVFRVLASALHHGVTGLGIGSG